MTTALVPMQGEWSIMKETAGMLVKTGFLPQAIKSPEQALAIMLKGRELQIPPMQAFAQIAVIQGKPAIGAELMLSLIYRKYPDAPIDIVRRDAEGCVIKASRPGRKQQTEFKFTLEDAKRADLMGKDNWRKYPDKMCFWRAVSDMARSLYADCLMGCSHTPEELGAEVNEEGEVVTTPVEPPRAIAAEVVEGVEIPFGNVKRAEPVKAAAKKSEARKAGIYTGTPEQQQIIRGILTKRGVPDEFWAEIDERMMNRPSTDLDAVIEDVRTGAVAEA